MKEEIKQLTGNLAEIREEICTLRMFFISITKTILTDSEFTNNTVANGPQPNDSENIVFYSNLLQNIVVWDYVLLYLFLYSPSIVYRFKMFVTLIVRVS